MRPMYTATTLVIAALATLAPGCSPGDEGGGGPPGEESELAHAQCMRDHGIDWPDPEFVDGEWELRVGDHVDLESPAFKEAETECGELRGDGGSGGEPADPADSAQQAADMDKLLEFAACMRAQGIEFPDPVIDDDGAISGPAGPVDGDWEAFDAAVEVCEDETGEAMP